MASVWLTRFPLWPQKPELSDGCCDYGELPLCFAACTNQPDIVGYLVEQGAHLDVITLHEGYSLLHLMVLHSAPRAKETDGDKIDSVEDVKWCLEMYDFIQVCSQFQILAPSLNSLA